MHPYKKTKIHNLYTGCDARLNFANWYLHKAHDPETEPTLFV